MWRNWDVETVEQDLKQLAEKGMQVLRVFPLWPDFQPITRLGDGRSYEYRFGEQPLPDDEAGRAGVSQEAIEEFRIFSNLAHQYGLKLIVGLITGWMSGRLFVPPALEGMNVLTDPEAIVWQVRFVRYFVSTFKDHPAILAWDLGNECNCMAKVPSRAAAMSWTATITNTIRAEDQTRPVVSGMHSLLPGREAKWAIQDQGEMTDLLTTHPYPIFTPHCDQDPVNTMRSCLHATAESRMYADIGGKPCLAEELGVLGPMICSEEIAADYVRTQLYSLWAHDCHGLLWWCAYDQSHLEHAPYDWVALERELGLFRPDRTPKPVLEEMQNFRAFISSLPATSLPQRMTEAVCILTEGQDQWGAAYASFVLAKQAGFDLEFQYADQPLRESQLYLMPSVSGLSSFSRRFWLSLMEKVKHGSTLYLSYHDGFLSSFEEFFGAEILTRQRTVEPVEMTVTELADKPVLKVEPPIKLSLRPTRAKVWAHDSDGHPMMTEHYIERGRTLFLSVPIETELSNTSGAFYGTQAQPFWKIYRKIATPAMMFRGISLEHPLIGVTEHPIIQTIRRVIMMINYSPEAQSVTPVIRQGWLLDGVFRGKVETSGQRKLQVDIPPNDAVVFTLKMGSD